MNLITCPNCGSKEFSLKDGVKICDYCASSFGIPKLDKHISRTEISLQSDIDRLLKKCITDPRNSHKYAGLILDIDPTNQEVLKYL